MNRCVGIGFLLGAFSLLVACGGGGGAGGGSGSLPVGPTATLTPSTTTAQGTLVDDPSGAPLSGVTVRLDPWIAYATPGPSPTPLAVSTTDPSGRFTLTNVPNGTYMLVIGSDAVNTPPPGWSTPAPCTASPCVYDTPIPGASGWRATIHDKIVLAGGGTNASPLPLVAPTMVPEPLYTPPAAETSGNYRLATIDAMTEAPCLLAFNQERAAHSLAAAVVDEWLVENTRAIVAVGMNPNGAGQLVHFVTSGGVYNSGGANCANDTVGFGWGMSALQPWLTNTQTLWFGGEYDRYTAQHSGYGAAEFPVDPRVYTDPNGLIWP